MQQKCPDSLSSVPTASGLPEGGTWPCRPELGRYPGEVTAASQVLTGEDLSSWSFPARENGNPRRGGEVVGAPNLHQPASAPRPAHPAAPPPSRAQEVSLPQTSRSAGASVPGWCDLWAKDKPEESEG